MKKVGKRLSSIKGRNEWSGQIRSTEGGTRHPVAPEKAAHHQEAFPSDTHQLQIYAKHRGGTSAFASARPVELNPRSTRPSSRRTDTGAEADPRGGREAATAPPLPEERSPASVRARTDLGVSMDLNISL
ncbi:hypothetical protein WMY93_020136 [Mugilogobius chulae]|uniref:Uncharacterized protein n=1 Tax=Mugilogobius chulae TaxID=88201 RepID=A0AAW0NJ42_9GOBI